MRVRPYVPGLLVVALIASGASLAGRALPVAGAPVLALLGGATLAAVWGQAAGDTGRLGPGLRFARQRVLQCAIVLLGLGLPFGALMSVGRRTAGVLLGTLVIGAVTAFVVGRWMALDRESATLVAVGTTICGASAIAAATAVIRPHRDTVGYALGTIFVFNIVAVLVFPPFGRLVGLSDEAFGLWAGTAINDTSSVLAAGIAFGPAAAQFAVIVKLARSLMIVPLCVGLHLESRRRSPVAGPGVSARHLVPLFIVLFLAASAVASTGVVPDGWRSTISSTSAWLITAALAAIGASLTWQSIRRAGTRPLLYGGILGAVLAVGSLALQTATGWR